MQEGLSRWKPTLMLVGATVVVVAVLVVFAGGRKDETTPTTPSASASETAPAPPQASGSVAPPPTAAPSPTVVATATTPAPTESASELPPGVLPPPGAPSGAGVMPSAKNITPEWQASKSEQALASVQARYDATQKEIDDLEKQGKPQEAQEKKILLGRLGKQITDIKAEITQYKLQAAGLATPDADTTK
jgi:hypothetical protein